MKKSRVVQFKLNYRNYLRCMRDVSRKDYRIHVRHGVSWFISDLEGSLETGQFRGVVTFREIIQVPYVLQHLTDAPLRGKVNP